MTNLDSGSSSFPSQRPEKLSGGSDSGSAFAGHARSLAILHDPRSSEADFLRLWSDLCRGRLRFMDVFHTEDRCYAILQWSDDLKVRRRETHERDWRIFERVLLGQPQKAVAIELGVSHSTIATIASRYLTRMGLRARGSNPPILLVIAAYAARGLGHVPGARLGCHSLAGRQTWVLSAPRPELRLAVGLSDAETAVLQRLVEGETAPEIARSRSTSRRTVANQLGAVFRKLGISGRGAVLGKLAARTSMREQPS